MLWNDNAWRFNLQALSIYGNYRAGLLSKGTFANDQAYAIDVTGNWWGAAEGPIYAGDCQAGQCDLLQSTWSQGNRDAIQNYASPARPDLPAVCAGKDYPLEWIMFLPSAGRQRGAEADGQGNRSA